jgi:hypothetical protein
MKFFIKKKKKLEEPPAPDINQLRNQTDMRILDSLIENLFEIDDQRAEELEKKSVE